MLAPTNPFVGNGSRGNLFGTTHGTTLPHCGVGPGALGMGRGVIRPQHVISLRDRPITQRHADLLHYALLHHPNTDEGHAAYRAQVVTWHTSNPHIKPDEQHQYPLTPGKSVASSRECWGCGIPGHSRGAIVCAG